MLHNFFNFSSIERYHACHIYCKEISNEQKKSDLCKMCNFEANPWKMGIGDHRILTYIFKWEG